MPQLTKPQFKEFVGALQNGVYEIVKSIVPDGEEAADGAKVIPHLVAEFDKTNIENWRGIFSNNFGKIHAYSIGYGGMKKRELERTILGAIQTKITFTIDGYYEYSHQKQSDLIFRDETTDIYLELETVKKLNLPNDLQSLLSKIESIEFQHVLVPVGDKNKVHAAFGEITVHTQPIQITN